MKLDWPLMVENITREDREVLIDFLKQDNKLTHGPQVVAFEKEWSEWLGVKHSVYVNSGASANLLTMAYLKTLYPDGGEVIVPTLTWVSDIATVIQNGFTPVFVDISLNTLGMSQYQVIDALTDKTRAVFITHVLGFNAITTELVNILKARNVMLIEDCCESHGATMDGQKLGTFGHISNFSFYFAHHMSTIEGGMICTDDDRAYQVLRSLRSHGLVREMTDPEMRAGFEYEHEYLNKEFIFAYPGYNVRPTEPAAVIGRNQLKRLDANNEKRTENLKVFLQHLDPEKYFTKFVTEGSVNYALPLVLISHQGVRERATAVEALLKDANVEYRRGLSGGGNQLRQPYLRKYDLLKYRLKANMVDHVHSYAWYIGNYPSLDKEKIVKLCELLNQIK